MLIENAPQIGEWLKQRPLLRWVGAVALGALLGQSAPWVISDIRPPAPCLMEPEQRKLDKAAEAAEVVAEVFGE